MSLSIIEILVPLVSVVIGAMIVHFCNTRMERNRQKTEARAVAAMLAAEIRTIVDHAEMRGYEEHYEEFARRFEAGDYSEMPSIRGLDDSLPEIAAACLEKLGALGPELSGDVVSWHSTLRSIKIDLLDLGSHRVPQDQCGPLLETVLKLWRSEVQGKAPDLIRRLQSM